jgi:hypothetical protein
MGMDGVEIVMLTEERFGIRIEDHETERIRTPGMLIDLVARKIGAASKGRCQSQRSFYLLRRALARVVRAPRGTIRLKTPIRRFVAREEQAEFWGKLRSEIGARSWPPLGLAREIEISRNAALFFLWIGATAALWRFAGYEAGIMGGVLAAALATMFLGRVAEPFKKFIPRKISKVKDLVPYVNTSNLIQWSRDDIARVVREIVEEILSVGDKYSEDADFINELGLS